MSVRLFTTDGSTSKRRLSVSKTNHSLPGIKEGRVVKGTSFVGLRDAGDPVELAARYNQQSADELIFLDIPASKENRGTTIDLASRLARELFIPFTIGGGISAWRYSSL
ncbi:MAG: hypothetical protein Ct9H90mP9_6030 [Pseudomonadota bacterium]|nr:MAG: hypothetical protein Ct9H90mP9_6030 [Pseudomonadota bacterium]